MASALSAPARGAVQRGRRRRGGALLMQGLVALTVAVLGSSWAWSNPHEAKATIDSFQYARLAYRYTGDSDAQSRQEAYTLRCGYWDQVRPPRNGFSAEVQLGSLVQRECPHGRTLRPRAAPRYEAIFAGRPAFPGLVAALLPALHSRAFAVVTLALAVACGLALFAAAMTLTGSIVASAVATGTLYVVPAGMWITRIGPEGGALLGSLLAVQGLVVALGSRPASSHAARWRDPRALGTALFVAGTLATYLFKSANATVLVAVMLVALVLLAVVRRSRLPLGLAGGVAGTGALLLVLNAVLQWPGTSATLQDTFTDHFLRPDVRHPFTLLLHVDLRIVEAFARDVAKMGLLSLVCVAVLTLVHLTSARATLWAALAPAGALVALAHPIPSQFDRLVLPMWVPLALALGAAAGGGLVALTGSARRTALGRHSATDPG